MCLGVSCGHDLWTHVDLVLSSSLADDCFAIQVCVFLKLNARRRLFAGFAAARRTMIRTV